MTGQAPRTQPNADLANRAVVRIEEDRRAFAAHPWWAIERRHIWTEDEKPGPGIPAVRPLPAKEYLRIITQIWLDHPKGLLCKSRQVLMSWLFAYLLVWDSIALKGRHNIFQGKRQDDVKATGTKGLLGRARFIREHLPFHLRPEVTNQESSIVESYGNGSVMEAIPEGKHIIRSKVPSNLVMDEIAFHETGAENWDTALPASGRVWGITTPNGRDFVYDQADPGQRWDEWREWPEIATGIHGYLNQKDIFLLAVHYTADPDRRAPEYQSNLRKGYTSIRRYMRENELDFALAEGQGVWTNEFHRSRHIVDRYDPDPGLPIHRGWDFGYRGQSVCLAQVNHEGQLVLFDQLIYKYVPLSKVVQEAEIRTRRAIGGSFLSITGDTVRTIVPQVMDYGDPASRQTNAKGETDVDTMSRYNIHLLTRSTKGRKHDLIEQVRALLLPRADGKPTLVVARNSPEMDHVISMFEGGYHYEHSVTGRAEKERAAKDGFFDHIADAIQYLVDNVRPTRPGFVPEEASGTGQEWWRIDELGVGNENRPAAVEEEGPLAFRPWGY